MTRVLISDSEFSARRRLAARIALDPDIILVGETSDGKAAAKLAKRLRPDAVVMDGGVRATGGLHAVEAIISESPSIRVLVFASGLHPKEKAQFLAAGAEACISKSEPMETVVDAIRGEKP